MNLNHRRPSSLRLRRELSESRANTEARWGAGAAATAATVEAEPPEQTPARRFSGDRRINKKNYALKWLATLASTGMLALLTINAYKSINKNDGPVDPLKLPRAEVTKVYVQPEGSHYPGGIAAELVNNDTDVRIVATEIQRENEGAHTVQTGVQLVLPTSQLDPKAVEAYQHGQQQ